MSPVSLTFNVWLDSFFVNDANSDWARGGISGGAGSGGGSYSTTFDEIRKKRISNSMKTSAVTGKVKSKWK